MHAQAVVANTINALATICAPGYNPPVTQQQAGTGLVDAGPAQAEDAGPARPGDAGPARPADAGPARAGGIPEAVSAWRALAASHAAVSAALERELGERHGLGVNEFEVLERLAENEEHKFRVQELAEDVHLSQSALSRLIGRLEQHGLVQRSLCDLDRRGHYRRPPAARRGPHAPAAPPPRPGPSAGLTGARETAE